MWYFSEPKFLSHATLRIIEQPYVAFSSGTPSRGSSHTQIELLRNPHIITHAIESANLLELAELKEIDGVEDAVVWITKRLKVNRIGQSELYDVAFTTKVRGSAQKVVKAIVDSYLRFYTTDSDTQREKILELLKGEQEGRNKDIQIKYEKLRSTAKQSGGIELVDDPNAPRKATARATARSAVLSIIRHRLIETDVEIEMTKARIAALDEDIDKEIHIPDGYLDAAMDRHPGVVKLTQELLNKEAML
jgi:uncharacterized protein involved in exopolysaccharide biosynthesis